MIRHYVARRAKVIFDHPHDAEDSMSRLHPRRDRSSFSGIFSAYDEAERERSVWRVALGRHCRDGAREYCGWAAVRRHCIGSAGSARRLGRAAHAQHGFGKRGAHNPVPFTYWIRVLHDRPARLDYRDRIGDAAPTTRVLEVRELLT